MKVYALLNVTDGRRCFKGHTIRTGEMFLQVRYGAYGDTYLDACAGHAVEVGYHDPRELAPGTELVA